MIIKYYQDLILRVHDILNKEIGITNTIGSILACSDVHKLGQDIPQVRVFLKSMDLPSHKAGFLLQEIFCKNKLEFVIYIKSDIHEDQKFLSLISFNISTLIEFYDEKHDRAVFLKKVINGGIESGEIGIKANKFHISNNLLRVVLLIKTKELRDVFVYEILLGLFPNKTRDFVISMSSEEIVLIKELKTEEEFGGIEKVAAIILDALQTEIIINAKIGIGTVVTSLEDLKKSYAAAKTSLEIGSIFNRENSIFSYGNLGIGRLVHQLPPDLCRLFLKEIFKVSPLVSLNSEILRTIQVFFENNLNVSETARKLYLHRNTLVYRLEKIHKLTGLDIIRFEDAVTLKVALLIKKFMDSIEKEG